MKRLVISSLIFALPSIASAATLEDLLADKGIITKAEAKEAAAAGGTKVYWNKGTKIEFPDSKFETQINTLFQTRYTFTDNDGSPNKSSFDVSKARIIISGTALNKEFSYKVNGDLVGSTSADGTKQPDLRDAYVAWKVCPMSELKMGQFKTLTSRQFNTEDDALQFPDRSLASDFFDSGRQDGLNSSFSFMEGALKANAAVFNGSSDGEGINKSGKDTKHTAVVNLRWLSNTKMNPFEEGDIDGTQDPAVTVGASYTYASLQKDFGDPLGVNDARKNSISVDAMLKYMGWSFAAELYHQNFDSSDVDGVQAEPTGFYAQAGYFVIPQKFEVAARFSMVDCDNGAAGGKCKGNDSLDAVDVSLNYYWWRNYIKGSIAYSWLSAEPTDSSLDNVDTSRWLLFMSTAL